MATSFTEGMARAILQAEQSHTRFENFCCKLFSEVDSCEYVPTSWNYDQARDGRTASLRDHETPPIICATLRTDVLDKAKEDAKSLAATTPRVKVVRFCSTQKLTESILDDIKNIFRKHCTAIETVLADGVIQIECLATRYPECFEKFYFAELSNLRSALAVSEFNSEKVQMTGMRIALTTQLGDDAQALREDLQKNLILTALSDGIKRTAVKLCKQVSEILHLPKVIQSDYLKVSLDTSERLGHIRSDDGEYWITESGQEELKDRTEKGSGVLSEGQTLIRDLLRVLTGEELEPEAFAKLWNTIQDEISIMFLANGIYIINSLESIIKNETTVADHPDLEQAIQNLGKKVAGLAIWGQRDSSIGQAVIDIFQEKTSDAFKWLSGLGAIYVSLCSLGLEKSAQNQIEARLREMDLLLDTDVILSLLSPGEPQHDSVISVVNCWRRIKGHVYVSPCVLEETAYHAWISHRDYEETWRILGKMNDSDALHLVSNAFVRGFRMEAEGKYEPSQWNYYVGQFQGADCYDYTKIQEILKDMSVVMITDEHIDKSFSATVTNTLLGPIGVSTTSEEFDKCERDGRLMAVLLRQRRERASVGGTALVVSSSRRLREACKRFKSILQKPEPVLPIGSIAYFLSLIPDANISFGVLREVLFDTGFPAKLFGLERMALRVVQASEEYFVPFARRGAFVVKLREKISETAYQQGRKAHELEADIVHGKKEVSEDIATIVASAVDSMVKSKLEKKVEQLQSEVQKLKGKDR